MKTFFAILLFIGTWAIGEQPRQSRIIITNLPSYSCDVYFNTTDHLYTKGEFSKSYSTPFLTPGGYYYNIRIVYTDNTGRKITLSRRVDFYPGQVLNLDASQFEMTAESGQFGTSSDAAQIKFEIPDKARVTINGEIFDPKDTRGPYTTAPIPKTEPKTYKIQIVFLDSFGNPRVYDRNLSLKSGEKVAIYLSNSN